MAWLAVHEVGGRTESLGPETRRHGGVEQQGANAIIERAHGVLGLAVLLAGVGARQMEHGAVSGRKRADGEVANSRPLSVCRTRMGRSNCVCR